MIRRICVKCPGCDEIITLRISMGLIGNQPFYYVCNNCNCPTKGILIIESGSTNVELEGGEVINTTTSTDQVYTFDPNLPTKSDAREMPDVGGSPFLFTESIIGLECVINFQTRASNYLRNINGNWLNLKRLKRFYLDSNWTRFDTLYNRTFRVDLSQKLIDTKVDALYQQYDRMFALILFNPYLVEMRREWNSIFIPTGDNAQAIADFQDELIGDSEFLECRESLFNCIEQYVDVKDAILSGFVLEMYPESPDSYGELRLFRDDFSELRGLYIQCFEICNKALTFIIESLNVINRGNKNIYLPQDELRNTPNNRRQFKRLNAKDRKYFLREIENWFTNWDLTLDRKLRNNLGHASTRHDLLNGILITEGQEPESYVSFISKVHAVLYPLIALINAFKIAEIHHIIRSR